MNLTATDLADLIEATAAHANTVWDRTSATDTEMRDWHRARDLLTRLMAAQTNLTLYAEVSR